MGRSTRFLGGRVLRSGRRVWTGPITDGKKTHDDDEPKSEVVGFNGSKKRKPIGLDQERIDKMYGIVYRRRREKGKRKRDEEICYFRRKKRRGRNSTSSSNAVCLLRKTRLKLSIVVGSCGSRKGVVSSLVHSILGYLRKADLRLMSLCAFVCSDPIVDVFAAYGVRFNKNFSFLGDTGSCVITGVRSTIPIFSVNFAGLPFVFLHLHSCLSLWSARSLVFCETDLSSTEEEEELNCIDEFSSFIRLDRNQTGCECVVGTGTRSQTECEFDVATGTTVVALPALRVNKVASQSVRVMNGCKIQKRRNSLRRGRSSSISPMQKSNGVSNIYRPRYNHIQVSSQVSTRNLRSSNQRKVLSDINGLESPPPQMTQKIGAISCYSNILVIESVKCYRVEGALATLELSESNRWCLTIRKDGVKRYSISAQKIMRPCGTNRITHDIIWSGDNDLKLEFPNRQDWLIFKELYMECFERNLKMPVPSFIPVPRVSDVDDYGEIGVLPFVRPHYYISVKDDELARALNRRTSNYDMDSDDEAYVYKINSVYSDESEVDEYLSAEGFELMIDGFEKACHCNPDTFTNAEAAYKIFPGLERKLVESVYGHWIMKRKLKRAALVRVFQFYQPRKSQLISKFNSRKKRSFKRLGSQAGRDKHRSFFQAFVTEQDTIEQQHMNKVQEAKATLERLDSLASEKRRRAQELFENAELASYKALMALRISEAAQLTESTDVAASYILG